MQSLTWYAYRLRAMSFAEMAWRCRSRARNTIDRCLCPARRCPMRLASILRKTGDSYACRPEILGSHLANRRMVDSERAQSWRDGVIARADGVLDHRLRLLGGSDTSVGRVIDWNYEYQAHRRTPIAFSPSINYRQFAVTGDAKWVWELNRHHHLVIFGRAYRLTGEAKYARAIVEHIESWIDQCPFGMGMNWRSPLELAIRLINWVWALGLIHGSAALSQRFISRILPVVYRHLWEISRSYSRYSSANNHLIGEAAGVFIGSSYFPGLKHAARWRSRSRAILMHEILHQTHPDGGHREQAMGYHVFVLQFFLLAGLCARNSGIDFSSEYWGRLEKMFEFVDSFSEGGDHAPMFGDCDDGYVLDVGGEPDDIRRLMPVGAALLGRSDFTVGTRERREPVFWLLGEKGLQHYDRLACESRANGIQSKSFPQSGRYLLQCGRQNGADRISVSFDCGELGYGSIAAHGHADALSFTLRAFGTDILVDPGTYDYFTYGEWRDYFRRTRAHNAIVIDDMDQSEPLGPFLWGRRARARCLRWQPRPNPAIVTGEHDGYSRLSDPVVHRRTIRLDASLRQICLRDEIIARGRHVAAMYLHFAEHCCVHQDDQNRFRVLCGRNAVTLELDPRLKTSVVRGSTNPPLGWVSRGYHCKLPTTTLVGRIETRGDVTLMTHICLSAPAQASPEEPHMPRSHVVSSPA
ncbi:MAG: alginate lyase family protein [Dehalococcoidia bacterium]